MAADETPTEPGEAPDLSNLRSKIDSVDDRLLRLLAERADLVPLIAEAKQTLGAEVVDPVRERALLDRLCAEGAGELPGSAIRAIFREIISASVSLQSRVKVAFLGPAGTYSHHAARNLFGYAPNYQEEATILGVVDAVRRGRVNFGVVPLENSTEGSVVSAIDALLMGGVQIRQELVLKVEHALMSRQRELRSIKRVYSHPQALAQCGDWLAENLSQPQLVHTASTVDAVKKALADEEAAAVGSPLASELHGLPILRMRIQDHVENATRFVSVGPRDGALTGQDRTTVAFQMDDAGTQGSLRRTLGIFDDHGVNLTRIESRPRRQQPWRYVFVVDLEGHRLEEHVAHALEELREHCTTVTLLGSYPKYRPPKD